MVNAAKFSMNASAVAMESPKSGLITPDYARSASNHLCCASSNNEMRRAFGFNASFSSHSTKLGGS